MKKNKTEENRSLKLDIETLRTLTSDDLNNVAGGVAQRMISLSVGCNCSEAQGCQTPLE